VVRAGERTPLSVWGVCVAGDGKCAVCDSYVKPHTLVRICDECNYGSYEGRCVICGGVGISDAHYCKECTIQEKDVRSLVARRRLHAIAAAVAPAAGAVVVPVVHPPPSVLPASLLCATFGCYLCPPSNRRPCPRRRCGGASVRVQRDGCPKIVNIGSARTDMFYERKKYGFRCVGSPL
jgi:hypothetical protein